MSCDPLKDLMWLEVLALGGILLPVFIGHYVSPLLGVIIALVWWLTPGSPYPILYVGSWLPFALAYPLCLYSILEGDRWG